MADKNEKLAEMAAALAKASAKLKRDMWRDFRNGKKPNATRPV